MDLSTNDLKAAKRRAAEELLETVVFFLTASIDKELASIDTRKRILDEDTARRINQINMLGLTEQDRIKETARVEKQAAFDQEQLEKRRRKLLVERAKFEKIANIASIIVNTAAAVIKALKDAPYPLNIGLAIATGAIGALQLARAIAAPIPQYRIGTDNAKKGMALVSEEGPELMERNGKTYITPNQPTLMEMVGGERITPAHITKDILNSGTLTKNMKGNNLILLQPNNGMSTEQAEVMIHELKDLKKEISRNRIMINNQTGIESSAYYVKRLP